MGPVAQWITRLTTDQKIPGSNPGSFDVFLVFFCFVFPGFFHTKTEMLGVCRAAAGTFVHGSVAERSKALV